MGNLGDALRLLKRGGAGRPNTGTKLLAAASCVALLTLASPSSAGEPETFSPPFDDPRPEQGAPQGCSAGGNTDVPGGPQIVRQFCGELDQSTYAKAKQGLHFKLWLVLAGNGILLAAEAWGSDGRMRRRVQTRVREAAQAFDAIPDLARAIVLGSPLPRVFEASNSAQPAPGAPADGATKRRPEAKPRGKGETVHDDPRYGLSLSAGVDRPLRN